MKKILALVLALAMILMVGASFADTNNLTADTTVSITNLDQGDVVTLYKIIKWDGAWKVVDGYTGLTQDEVNDIVKQNDVTGAAINNAAGWTDAYINKVITSTLPTPVALGDAATVGASKTFTATVEPGMYYALVTPKDGTKIYKPMFVSADYSSTSTTTTVAAKSETVTLDKESISQTNDQDSDKTYTHSADSDNTVGVGDVVEFTLTTTIPNFPASFTNPIFKVSDSLSHLELVVKSDAKDIRVYSPSYDATNLVAATNYTLTSDSATAFEVAFTKDFIQANGGKQVVVVYTATVKNDGTNIIDNHDNTAKVNFSNNPDDEVGANEVEDHTEHYSFTINGDVWTEKDSTDIVKVGINADGTEITQDVVLPNSHYVGALQGAQFTLYTNNAAGTGPSEDVYRSDITSGADGRFTISDLDAGIYWLVETQAPAGYVKQSAPVKIEIIPTFATHTVAAQTKTVQYDQDDSSKTVQVTVPAYSYPELVSYKILIDGSETASYSFKNDEIDERHDDKIGETVSGGDEDADNDDLGKVKNPKGTELPSTGGIGTTIFYIVGGILLIGAAVILVARRKAHD